ncbi:MAG: hypothetical protein DCC58_18645 [Chloroflexi bacterium]|nr:MAG: hypothetical protein DCC58_18645 [Chloroflexota bacterium]
MVGVFDMLPRKGQVLREGFERLRREGYIGEESAQFDTPTGPHRYTWPILLEKGREQLLRGELLGW